jgi:hypothetical protein
LKQFKTKWHRKTLYWFWSDAYWYVTTDKGFSKGRPIAQHKITGCGKTKDEAFLEFRSLILVNQQPAGQDTRK